MHLNFPNVKILHNPSMIPNWKKINVDTMLLLNIQILGNFYHAFAHIMSLQPVEIL